MTRVVAEDLRPTNDTADVEMDEKYEKYEIKRCADWINTNRHRKICLQFPDDLLGDAVAVKSRLQKCTDADLYVSADATFRSCCADLKTAKHVNADALIHFGRVCSSRFQSKTTASLFVLPKEYLNVDVLVERVSWLITEKSCNVVLLYDIAFAGYVYQLDDRLSASAFRSNVSLSRLLAIDNEVCDAIDIREECQTDDSTLDTSTKATKTVVKKLGRQYRVDFSDSGRILVYVYILSTDSRKNFENFLLSSPESTFYSYDSRCDVLSAECIPKSVKKTLFQVEKVKQARRIGILVATLEAHSFLDAVRRIKKLCALKMKKAYIISVGKPNVAKLANFPEIDLFVLISCPEVEIVDRRDYYQPIVSAMELELALNDNHGWTGKFVADFSEFLPGGSEYKPVDGSSCNFERSSVDVSLLNNRLIGVDSSDGDTSAVVHSAQSGSVVSTVDSSQYCLANRSWTGLRTNMGDDDDSGVSTATVGRKGTPAAGYKTQFADHVT